MPSTRKKDLSLSVLVAAVVAAAGLLPLAYHYGKTHRPVLHEGPIAAVPAPAPDTEADADAAAPPPPGAESVPAEETETDRGPASASPAGPTLSFARAAGLHHAPDPLRLNSSVALVVDQDTGQVLVSKNDQAVLPVASLTKLMSTLVVLEANQPMDEILTITEEDVDRERNSRSRLRVGTSLTRQEALLLALMSSENRAAHALGRAYPGGLPKLVEAMNARAKQLGMVNTTYVDPTGLSNRNQSTARDVALLVAETAKHPLLREFSTSPAHLASLGGRTLHYKNSNRLVRSEGRGWDIELQKTGYIVEAGRCLTMLTRVAGHDLIMVLLDADSNGARMTDAERLRRWVVAQNGWQDDLAVAQADDKPVRKASAERKARSSEKPRPTAARDKDAKVASAKKPERGAAAKKQTTGKDTAVAQKQTTRKAPAVAQKDAGRKATAAGKKDGDRKPTAVAKTESERKARVRQTFAAKDATNG